MRSEVATTQRIDAALVGLHSHSRTAAGNNSSRRTSQKLEVTRDDGDEITCAELDVGTISRGLDDNDVFIASGERGALLVDDRCIIDVIFEFTTNEAVTGSGLRRGDDVADERFDWEGDLEAVVFEVLGGDDAPEDVGAFVAFDGVDSFIIQVDIDEILVVTRDSHQIDTERRLDETRADKWGEFVGHECPSFGFSMMTM